MNKDTIREALEKHYGADLPYIDYETIKELAIDFADTLIAGIK